MLIFLMSIIHIIHTDLNVIKIGCICLKQNKVVYRNKMYVAITVCFFWSNTLFASSLFPGHIRKRLLIVQLSSGIANHKCVSPLEC